MPLVASPTVIDELQEKFGPAAVTPQSTRDFIPTFWTPKENIREVVAYLKNEIRDPYRMLYDLTVLDERVRTHRDGQPESGFSVVYHLFSFHRNQYIRIKVPLPVDHASLPTVTSIFPAANWYEREAWDMFGVVFEGHPHLVRILMPRTWVGHPLRKDHPARATEMEPYRLDQKEEERDQEALRFKPEEWGMQTSHAGAEYMFLNVGPQHPGTHGVLRIVLQLDGEEIVDAVPDIGYHHRAQEKMAERQTWHTYLPYTDRVDYLSGVVNNFAYLTAV